MGPVVLYAARQPEDQRGAVRAAFVTGKKLGKAVQRNKVKRRLREAFRERVPYIEQGWDLLWIARPSILEVSFERIQKNVLEALRRGRLLAATDGEPRTRREAPSAAEVRNEDAGPVEHQVVPKDT